MKKLNYIKSWILKKTSFSNLNYMDLRCQYSLKDQIVLIIGNDSLLRESIIKTFEHQGASINVITHNNIEEIQSIHDRNRVINVLINIVNNEIAEQLDLSVDVDSWNELYNMKLYSILYSCQIVTKLMIKDNIPGHLINIFSKEVFEPTINPSLICEWTGIGLTKGLGMALAKEGLVINGIAIGTSVPTDKTSELVLFLSSPHANNIIGEVITLD